jgi:agmatinase
MGPIDVLSRILQPQGIKVVTTGVDEIAKFLRGRYGTIEPADIQTQWSAMLARIASAKVVLLGIPMDIGAGFERGSFKGPLGIRSQFLRVEGLYARLETAGVLDIGDVRVNPSLFTDEMLNAETLKAMRVSRWPDASGGSTGDLPVSPLSILERALDEIFALAPQARVHLVGGDHSLSMVPTTVLARSPSNHDRTLGVVHFDAHTDLLTERDGLRCSFATWAHHANVAIGKGGRLQQLGTRISGFPREHWESTCQVRQFWSDEIHSRGTEEILDELCGNLKRAGVERLYLSNDVDGTDPRWVAATGTMVNGGMNPEFVSAAILRLQGEFQVVGADVVELAPPLKWHIKGEPARSNQTAAHYTLRQLDALLGRPNTLAREIPIPEPATEEEVWSLPPFA